MPYSQLDDIQMYYETFGEGDALMLVSGTGDNCDSWRRYQVPAFAAEYRVIIFDHRGVGKSDAPDEPYSTRGFAADAVQLLDNLGIERAHVLGHSMGGRVAQWMALDHPHKIRSLILSSSGSGQFSPHVDIVRGLPLKQTEAMIKMGYENWWNGHFADEDFMFPPEIRQNEPQLLAQRRDMALNSMPQLRPYLRHVIARQQHETTDLLNDISAPTLVIVGEKDRTIGGTGSHFESSKALAKAIPKSELVVMKDAAHGYMWQMPDEANAVMLAFLRRN